MKVFVTKWFKKYAKKTGISNELLIQAIRSAEKGLIDAYLGANIIKLRIARKGRGKSSGYRTILAFQHRKKSFFIYCFSKNERENIDDEELVTLKELSARLIAFSNEDIKHALVTGELSEVDYE